MKHQADFGMSICDFDETVSDRSLVTLRSLALQRKTYMPMSFKFNTLGKAKLIKPSIHIDSVLEILSLTAISSFSVALIANALFKIFQ